LETPCHTLNFCSLDLKDNSYLFAAKRELAGRNVIADSIKYVKHGIIDGVLTSVTMKQSGKLDIYYDMVLIDEVDNIIVKDFEIDNSNIYLQNNASHILKIDVKKWKQRSSNEVC